MENHRLTLSEVEFDLFLEGDSRVFTIIYNQYYTSLIRYISNFTSDTIEVEDIVQQSFIQLFKYRNRIQDAEGIYPYLFVIAKRNSIMLFRKKVLEAKYKDEALNLGTIQCEQTENRIEYEDLNLTLHNLIKTLPEKQGKIYTLNKIDGFSYEEIAIETGISKHTVKNHIATASKKVKTFLNKYYFIFFI